jgi:hypothetical protein
MSDTTIIRQVRLGPKHQATGKTRHLHGEKTLPAPAFLQVVQYSEDPGFYLLYLDENRQELTDTYHESLDGALEQARWEFSVKPAEWEVVQK